MTSLRARVFPTAFGPCAVAWSSTGLRRVQLPDGDEEGTRAALTSSLGDVEWATPPSAVAAAIRRIAAHLDGALDPFTGIKLDLAGRPDFARRIYRRLRSVRPGRTVGYGELAERCGNPGASRAVGQAMASNPLPLLIPCHRVVAADGSLGHFSAPGGVRTKLRLLTIEEAETDAIVAGGLRQLRRADERLARAMRAVGPFELHFQQRDDHFTALAEAIVHQQLSMKAGSTIFRRLLETIGGAGASALDPAAVLRSRPARLRSAGLSRQKASYLTDLARRVVERSLPLARARRMDDERLIEALCAVKGIGRWSAEMFLIFRLGRLDVLPVDDLGLRRGAQTVFRLRELPNKDELSALARPWVPFRSLASWYLWRVRDAGGLA